MRTQRIILDDLRICVRFFIFKTIAHVRLYESAIIHKASSAWLKSGYCATRPVRRFAAAGKLPL